VIALDGSCVLVDRAILEDHLAIKIESIGFLEASLFEHLSLLPLVAIERDASLAEPARGEYPTLEDLPTFNRCVVAVVGALCAEEAVALGSLVGEVITVLTPISVDGDFRATDRAEDPWEGLSVSI